LTGASHCSGADPTLRIAIIANPVSGGGRAFRRLNRLLRAWPHSDWDVELHTTRCPGHAGALARELQKQPPDLLAVCGGDGTLSDVASNVPEPSFPVALLPGGTANVLAHEFDIPLDPVRAMEIALRRTVRRVDLGILEGRDHRRFLLMAGVGLDAYVVSKIRPGKRKLGIAAYYAATLRALATYSFPEFRVILPGEVMTASSCIIANAAGYGGGLVLTPDADMSDGMLDLLILQGKPRISHLRVLSAAWLGKPIDDSSSRRRIAALRIEGKRGIWIQADGELTGTLPVDVSLAHAGFPLVVPG